MKDLQAEMETILYRILLQIQHRKAMLGKTNWPMFTEQIKDVLDRAGVDYSKGD